MKNLIVIFLSVSSLAFSQEDYLANTSWRTYCPVFESDTVDSYILEEQEDRTNTYLSWGHSISFGQDGSFHTSYSAPCGVDCFTSISGTYSFIDRDRVVIYVSNIQRNGFCQQESESPEKTYGQYSIERKDNKLVFKRVFQ